MAKKGRAAITWSSTGDTATQRVHNLELPLTPVTLGLSLASFTRENLDRSKVEYFSIGSGASTAGAVELAGTVRMDKDPHSLIDLLRAGSQGKTLTYYPDLADPDTNLPVQLLGPLGDAGVALDPDRVDEYTVDLRFRSTAGAFFNQPVDQGTNVLFWWRAGDNLEDATFSRVTSTATPASYGSNSGGGGYGTLTTAATNKARIEWVNT